MRWIWERPLVVAAIYLALVALDLLVFRWPPQSSDVLQAVLFAPVVAYMLLRRERVRQFYFASHKERRPVRVRPGIRGVWDRLWNFDLAIERWPWTEPLLAAAAAAGAVAILVAFYINGNVDWRLFLTALITVATAITGYIVWWWRR